MLEAFAEIHWIAAVAGTLVFAVLGGIYFMALVPKQYLYVTGREDLPKEQQKVSGAIFVVGPILCSLIVVIADAYLVTALEIASVVDAAVLGLVVGFGFLVPMTFNIAINPLFRRPIQYGLLNAPYFLIANLIACILMVAIPFSPSIRSGFGLQADDSAGRASSERHDSMTAMDLPVRVVRNPCDEDE